MPGNWHVRFGVGAGVKLPRPHHLGRQRPGATRSCVGIGNNSYWLRAAATRCPHCKSPHGQASRTNDSAARPLFWLCLTPKRQAVVPMCLRTLKSVLGLVTVDSFHVQRVPQHEGNVLAAAEIGQPVPCEHAFDADDKFFAIEADRVEKVVRSAGQVAVNERFAGLADDSDVHRLGMQIDAAVESMLLRVKSHHGRPWKGQRLSPHLSTGSPRSTLCAALGHRH